MSRYECVRDRNGDGLSIRYRGLPRLPLSSILVTLIILLFNLVFFSLIVQNLAGKVSDDWFMRFDWLWRIAAVFAIMGGPLLLISYFVLRSFVPKLCYLRSARWDGERGIFNAVVAHLIRRKKFSCQTHQIRSVDGYICTTPDEVELEVVIEAQNATCTFDVVLEEGDSADYARELLYAMGRASGHRYFTREKIDSEQVHIRITPDSAGAGSQPLPNRKNDEITSGRKVGFIASVQNAFQAVVVICVLLVFVGVLGFFAYGTYIQGQREARYREIVGQIRSQGHEVIRTSVAVGEKTVLHDGFLIHVSDPEFNDQQFADLFELVREFPQYGFDLSDTSITDQSFTELQGNFAFSLLAARNTKLTGKAIESLSKAQVRCLDVRDTAIVIDDLKHFSKNYSLYALYLTDNDVTAQDRSRIDSIPYLDYVHVNDKDTTTKILESANADIEGPDSLTEFERVQYVDRLSLKFAPEPELYLDEE